MDEAAILDARRNASSNGITNATFGAADLDRDLPEALKELRPDVVIVGARTLRASYNRTHDICMACFPGNDCADSTML